MQRFLRHFEHIIVLGLLAMMSIVVFVSTLELGVILVEEMVTYHKFMLLDVNELLRIFGFFLMILIGLELLETIKVYIAQDTVHVEIIFLVAIIAMTRKIIILDVKELPPLTLIGIAAIILSLSVGYYVLKKALNEKT
jgi:uncharacterized membrane protein (DUF373 family)